MNSIVDEERVHFYLDHVNGTTPDPYKYLGVPTKFKKERNVGQEVGKHSTKEFS
jgi:hypothetical protein